MATSTMYNAEICHLSGNLNYCRFSLVIYRTVRKHLTTIDYKTNLSNLELALNYTCISFSIDSLISQDAHRFGIESKACESIKRIWYNNLTHWVLAGNLRKSYYTKKMSETLQLQNFMPWYNAGSFITTKKSSFMVPMQNYKKVNSWY